MRFWVRVPISIALLLAPTTGALSQPQTWAKVRQESLWVELVETGEIGAVNSTIVASPQIWALDLQIIDMVPEGRQVDSGTVLVQFDRSALLTRLSALRTDLDMHRATMRRIRAEHQASLRGLEREVEMAEYALKLAQVQLEQLKYESETRRQNGELEVLKAEIALNEAKSKLEAQAIINQAAQKQQQLKILQAQGEVDRIQRQLDQLTLRAPIAGMVVYHADWDGSKPQVGGKVRPGRGIIDLPDLSRMQVKIRVNEVDAARLRDAMEAVITLDAFPTKQFHGRLVSTTKIAAAKEQESQVRVFEAILEITESDSLLKPGMTAKVRLQLDLVPDATVIPIGCVYEMDGKPVVFTKESPHKPVPVQLGARSDFFVSVNGLAVGGEVAWQAGMDGARPLGQAAYQQEVRPPASTRQDFFAEMERRRLVFDYEAFRQRPPGPAGPAPGGAEAMVKRLGLPAGDLAAQGGRITVTPEMMKSAQQLGGTSVTITADSAQALQKVPAGTVPSAPKERMIQLRGAPGMMKLKIDSTKAAHTQDRKP